MVDHHCVSRIADALTNVVKSEVTVALETESDYVLESLHKSPVSYAKLVLAFRGVVVSDYHCNSTICFDLEKSVPQPSDVITRVVSLSIEEKVDD